MILLQNPFHFPTNGTVPLYVSQYITESINDKAKVLLSTLNAFQVRTFQTKPLKAKASRRLVFGAREIIRDMDLGRIEFIMVCKDLDEAFIDSDAWTSLKDHAHEKGVTLIYALSCKEMSTAIAGNPRVHIGLVGVRSVDGARELACDLLEECSSNAAEWRTAFTEAKSSVPKAIIASYYGHVELLTQETSDSFLMRTGDSIAHAAAARGHCAVLKWIESTKRDLLVDKNFSLQAPLDLAKSFGRVRAIQLLESLPKSSDE